MFIKNFILSTICFISLNALAGWEIYDNFNGSSIDGSKWDFPEGTSGLVQSGGLLKFNSSKTIRSDLPSNFHIRGIRAEVFLSNGCATSVNDLSVGTVTRSLRYQNQSNYAISYSQINISADASDKNAIVSNQTAYNEGPETRTALTYLEAAIPNDNNQVLRNKYTGRWIKLTTYFEKTHKLRFWTNLSGNETIYVNRDFNFTNFVDTSNNNAGSGKFDIFVEELLNNSSSDGCNVWFDNVWVYR